MAACPNVFSSDGVNTPEISGHGPPFIMACHSFESAIVAGFAVYPMLELSAGASEANDQSAAANAKSPKWPPSCANAAFIESVREGKRDGYGLTTAFGTDLGVLGQPTVRATMNVGIVPNSCWSVTVTTLC